MMVGWIPRVRSILRISSSSFLGPSERDRCFVCECLGQLITFFIISAFSAVTEPLIR